MQNARIIVFPRTRHLINDLITWLDLCCYPRALWRCRTSTLTSLTLSHKVHPSFVNNFTTTDEPSISYIEPVMLCPLDSADPSPDWCIGGRWTPRGCDDGGCSLIEKAPVKGILHDDAIVVVRMSWGKRRLVGSAIKNVVERWRVSGLCVALSSFEL